MLDSATGQTGSSSTGRDGAVVVGLGNPGADYAGNRHNVGAMVVTGMAAELRAGLKRGRGKLARVLSSTARLAGQRVVLATLTTYMNESGQAVRPLLDYFKIDPTSLIVIHDELDLPFGVVRIKRAGGDSGHNGLRSITRAVGSRDYIRIRVGIGRPPGRQQPADFVLRDFSAAERVQLPGILGAGAEAVNLIVAHGVERAQNEIHRPD